MVGLVPAFHFLSEPDGGDPILLPADRTEKVVLASVDLVTARGRSVSSVIISNVGSIANYLTDDDVLAVHGVKLCYFRNGSVLRELLAAIAEVVWPPADGNVAEGLDDNDSLHYFLLGVEIAPQKLYVGGEIDRIE